MYLWDHKFIVYNSTTISMASTRSAFGSAGSYSSKALDTDGPFQLGRTDQPMQVHFNGHTFADTASRCYAAKLLVLDPDSIRSIEDMEQTVSANNPDCKLNSVILDRPDVDGVPAILIRAKLTNSDARFSKDVNTGIDNAAGVTGLKAGSTILAMCRAGQWSMDGRCGLLVYCNDIRYLGDVALPWVGPRRGAVQMEWL